MEHGFTGHEHYDRFVKVRGERYLRKQDPSTANFQLTSHLSPFPFYDPDGNFFVFDSWIVGFVSSLVKNGSLKQSWNDANQRAANDLKIWGGLFVTDSNKSFLSRSWEFVSRFTWQLPQTFVGWGLSQTKNLVGAVDRGRYICLLSVHQVYVVQPETETIDCFGQKRKPTNEQNGISNYIMKVIGISLRTLTLHIKL